MMKRIRLIKVIVQPVIVIDDGDSLTEVEHPPMVIPAADWPTYSTEQFPAELSAWEASLNDPEGKTDD